MLLYIFLLFVCLFLVVDVVVLTAGAGAEVSAEVWWAVSCDKGEGGGGQLAALQDPSAGRAAARLIEPVCPMPP